MVQGLLVLNDETYVYKRWHGMLLYWAFLLLASVTTIHGSRMLPGIENASMVLHICLFVVLIVVLCAVSPTKQPASYVFTHFENNTGWESNGLAWCIGLLSSCYVMAGEYVPTLIDFAHSRQGMMQLHT